MSESSNNSKSACVSGSGDVIERIGVIATGVFIAVMCIGAANKLDTVIYNWWYGYGTTYVNHDENENENENTN